MSDYSWSISISGPTFEDIIAKARGLYYASSEGGVNEGTKAQEPTDQSENKEKVTRRRSGKTKAELANTLSNALEDIGGSEIREGALRLEDAEPILRAANNDEPEFTFDEDNLGAYDREVKVREENGTDITAFNRELARSLLSYYSNDMQAVKKFFEDHGIPPRSADIQRSGWAVIYSFLVENGAI